MPTTFVLLVLLALAASLKLSLLLKASILAAFAVLGFSALRRAAKNKDPANPDAFEPAPRATAMLSDMHPLRARDLAQKSADPWPGKAMIKAYEAPVANPLDELLSATEQADLRKRADQDESARRELRKELGVDTFTRMPHLSATPLTAAVQILVKALSAVAERFIALRLWGFFRAPALIAGLALGLCEPSWLATGAGQAALTMGLALAKLPADPAAFAGNNLAIAAALGEGALRVIACGVVVQFLGWLFTAWGPDGFSGNGGAKAKKAVSIAHWLANLLDFIGWLAIGAFLVAWIVGAAPAAAAAASAASIF